ncbi:MAG: ATP-binding cassette domain-containing protein [Eubacterium sp.]|nr:ATP-binding cassette domain-containing protein [Eubacterium sp.]MCM1217130.1 ATP-binding cassette domain-containing protein [Lachnospiraceae bacterium]MCM1240348.1 ATP-binding cassette domain-containing protein [Lachnospiraceae bacterium]
MKKKNLRKAIIILAWLIVWQIAAMTVDNSILMAAPLEVLGELFSMLGDAGFYQTVCTSLLRIGCGFLAGSAVAVALAAVSSGHPLFEEALSPMMALLKTIPVASFVVLLLIWWGSSFLAVAICFVVVLPNIYINTLEGLKNTDRQLLEMAQVFHMPVKNRFFYIYRPAIAPFLYSGMKISLGMCWKSGVAAEVIGTPDHSIGEGLYLSKVYLDTAGVFAWTTVVILLSVLFEKMILWMAGRFFKWEPACSGQTVSDRIPAEERRGNAGGKQAETLAASSGRLEVSHLCKSFGSQQVISDFCAVYEPGRTYILDAPSGSGKTTLLHMLAGILEPDSGVIKGGGICSMVFQEDRLCLDYSAVKNVEMVTGDPLQAKAALETLLEPESLQKPCGELSGGMKRRVALIRAMEAESDYVLLDEPFTGMDADTRSRAEECIRQKQNGRLVILVTHDRNRLGKG